eukprot:2204646-Rhodomonas_salina.1
MSRFRTLSFSLSGSHSLSLSGSGCLVAVGDGLPGEVDWQSQGRGMSALPPPRSPSAPHLATARPAPSAAAT